MPRPRMFVSSTIYDFRDLRSALAYWASERGFEVQMSELTNFDRRPENDVFAACFENVKSADVFVLLLGQRRGAWYDQGARISVTQQEFRVARESNRQTGRPRILSFVRKSTAQAIRMWDALDRPGAMNPELDDPEFSNDFLTDVKGSNSGHAEYWIAEFDHFSELVRGVEGQLGIASGIEGLSQSTALEEEVLTNLSEMVGHGPGGSPFPHHAHVRRDAIRIDWTAARMAEAVSLSVGDLECLGPLAMAVAPVSRLQSACIDEIARSGVFRRYDPSTATLAPTELHRAVVSLSSEFGRLRRLAEGETIQRILLQLTTWLYEVNREGRTSARILTGELTFALALYDAYENVFARHLALARFTIGLTSSPFPPRLRGPSPDPESSERLVAERVPIDEVRKYIRADAYPFGSQLTRTDLALLSENRQDPDIRASGIAALKQELGDAVPDEQIEALFDQSFERALVELESSAVDPE